MVAAADDFLLLAMRPDVAIPIKNDFFGSVRLDTYKSPALSVEHTPQHNTIVVSQNLSPVVAKFEIGGERREKSVKFGDVLVFPAGVTHSATWEKESDYIVTTIETSFYRSVEHRCPDRMDLLPLFPYPDPLIQGIVQMFGSICRPISLEYIDQVALTLVLHLLEFYGQKSIKEPENNYVFSSVQLRMMDEYIDVNLHRYIPLQELAELLNVSISHFSRTAKASVGVPPAQYIMNKRLARAILLLKGTTLSIGSIANTVGFCDHSHLCRVFQACLASTPDQYRD
jgi:AraC family transcriptional regulator